MNNFKAEEIKTLRKKLGLSQIDFAEKLHVVKTTVANWEQGKTHPSQLAERQLNRLARKA